MSDWRRSVSEHFKEVRERDTKWILQFKVGELNRRLFPLLAVLIALEFADVALTLSALWIGPPLIELNPIASALFHGQFIGFLLALGLKYTPLVPIAYGALMGDRPARPVRIRVLKLGVFVALVASILLTAGIVANNAIILVSYYA